MEDSSRGHGGNEDLTRRAGERLGGVAAAVVVWHRVAGLGTVARLRVSDTQRLGWVEVRIPADTPLPFSSAIEFAVEELATTVPAEGRLDALERLSPLLWTGRGVE